MTEESMPAVEPEVTSTPAVEEPTTPSENNGELFS